MENSKHKADLTQRGQALLGEVELLARQVARGSSIQQEFSSVVRSFATMEDVLRQTDDNISRQSFHSLQEFKQQIQYISFSLNSITPTNAQLRQTLALLREPESDVSREKEVNTPQ